MPRSLFFILAGALLVIAPSTVRAASADLHSVFEALAPVRAKPGSGYRNAGPELTPVKTALRQWVEEHLPAAFNAQGYPASYAPDELLKLGFHLTEALGTADLTCREGQPARCLTRDDEFDARGYVGDIRIGEVDGGHYLIVVTSVGIYCGYDQSAYVYDRGPDRHWRLILQSERDDYADDRYAAQQFLTIDVSPEPWDKPGLPLVLTLGYPPSCVSNWHVLYSQLWRTSSATTRPAPILDRSDELYMGDDQIASARLTRDDVLIEFHGRSIDSGTLVRRHVLHYRVGPGDRLQRFGPVALSPEDFVEEWLDLPWTDARRWTGRHAAAGSLLRIHKALHEQFGEFDGPSTRCRRGPSLWQVGLADRHFLVRWAAPYSFTLLAARTRPFPGCNEKVVMPENLGTLFPPQGWTP